MTRTPNLSPTDPEPRRMHVALETADLDAAVGFYRAFFDREPAKHKPRYAKFMLEDPPLALALIETGKAAPAGRLNHLGIQVASSEAVQAAIDRLGAVGLAAKVEREVDCCYARQDKVWAVDPDGNRWEVYAVLADADRLVPTADTGANEPATFEGAVSTVSAQCCAPANAA